MRRKKSVDEIMAEFRRKMQQTATAAGSSITISSGGRSVTFEPKPTKSARGGDASHS